MAYPPRRTGASMESTDPLPPPRPFFLAEPNRSSSASSLDISSLDPPSDSDSPSSITGSARRLVPHVPRSSTATTSTTSRPTMTRPPAARRRSSSRERQAPGPTMARRDSGTWDPSLLYTEPTSPPAHTHAHALSARPPPSSFAFPFQAYPGNPDPLPNRRRASLDSTVAGTVSDDHTEAPVGLRKPFAPFMASPTSASSPLTEHTTGGSTTSLLPRSASNNSLYKASAAAAASLPNSPGLSASEPAFVASSMPRNASTHSFRAPFLAPSSRPTSSLWAPPSYPAHNLHHQSSALASPSASTTALELASPASTNTSPYIHALAKPRPPPPSTRLSGPLTKEDKPWLATRPPRALLSYFMTLLFIVLGIAGAAFLCFTGVQEAQKLLLDPNSLCLVMDDDFTGADLDTGSWVKDVELGGFGVGAFDMSTGASDNLYIRGGELYFMPTLTPDNIVNGGNYTLPGCTSTNKTACAVTASKNGATVVNPVMSSRINTKGKKSMRFGKVEVRAKMPVGDWLTPFITLLPENSTYGATFPLSGQITLAQARGNAPTYPAEGRNFVTSSLEYGPFAGLVERIFGWYSLKRSTFADGFHIYTLEWTPTFIRMSVDTRAHTTLLTTTQSSKTSYWNRAHFPETFQNGSTLAVVQDIYSEAGGWDAAPFDQDFYLGLGLGVGGTNGWFPDNVGGKMWFDGSLTAMRDFAREKSDWSSTWPAGDADRAFRIDYVKMWKVCN